MGDARRNLLNRLDHAAKEEVSDIFHGTGELGGNICKLCSEINCSIDSFFDSPSTVDLSDASTINFLRSTLPILIEVLLRRKTLRCVLFLP